MILDTYQQCSKRHGLFIDCKLKNNDEENEQHTKFRTSSLGQVENAHIRLWIQKLSARPFQKIQ